MISIDYKNRTPFYEQIINSIEHLVILGVLKQDEKLPSVRSLAVELSINPNTIQKAFTALEMTGMIYTVKGVGNFISSENSSLKNKKLDDFYLEMREKTIIAKTYGLNLELFDKFVTSLRGEF